MSKKPRLETMSIERLYKISKLLTGEDRAIFYALYLSAGRIKEVLMMRPEDLRRPRKDLLVFSLITEKNRKQGYRDVPVVLDTDRIKNMGTYLWNFRRLRKKEVSKYLFEYVLSTHTFNFNSARTKVWKEFKKQIGGVSVRAVRKSAGGLEVINHYEFYIFPHYLRHCRLTSLVRDYPLLSAYDLQYIAGWTSPAPAATYLHFRAKRLAAKMKRTKISSYE